MNHHQLKQYINDLIIPPNGRYRGNCPVCGNSNTFSLVQDGLETYYNCFHINCHTKGVMKNELNLDRLINRGASYNNGDRGNVQPVYLGEPPGQLFMQLSSSCYDYLRTFTGSSGGPYITATNTLKYDPKQHRLVFPLEYKGENYGFVGRAITANVYPKWYVYQRRMACPYIVDTRGPNGSRAILVEDCISAIRASAVINAVALLGTNLTDGVIPYLLSYSKLYVALDADATKKSIDIQKKLSYYKETDIIRLDKDIKYYNEEELKKLECLIN